MDGLDVYYTKKEVARRLRCDVTTVERMIRDRRISSTKPFGRVLVPKSEVHGLESGKWEPARPPE